MGKSTGKANGLLAAREGDRPNGAVTVTPLGVALVERMAREGQDVVSVAKALGMSGETLRQVRKRQPEVAEAMDRGHAGLSDELTHILLKHAREGNVVAAIYLSKARCGWRDQGPVDGGADTKVNVQIVLPRSLTMDEYMKTLEHEPAPLPLPKPKVQS